MSDINEEIEKAFEEKSQEIYLVSPQGDVYFIDFQSYQDKVISRWDINDPQGIFNKDKQLPINLLGQTVTKVIQWNLDDFVTQKEVEKYDLKPGFLLDLRSLAMPKQLSAGSLSINTSAANAIATTQQEFPPQVIQVPKEYMEQLKDNPELNLYIASWQKPLGDNSQFQLNGSQMSYISFAELQKYKKGHIDDAPELLKETDFTNTMEYLKNYYVDVGVQSGALNALDHDILSTAYADEDGNGCPFIFCYIANLKSFNQS